MCTHIVNHKEKRLPVHMHLNCEVWLLITLMISRKLLVVDTWFNMYPRIITTETVTLTFRVKDPGANALKSRYRVGYWEQGVEFDMCPQIINYGEQNVTTKLQSRRS